MSAVIEKLVRQALESANAGRWQQAERLWLEVRSLEPGHPQALFSLGVHALTRSDGAVAHELLTMARAVAPHDLLVLMTLAAARQLLGNTDGEREAIEAALAVDAYFLPALLAKGNWLERHDSPAATASTYGNCLKIAPPEAQWPAALRPQLEHARKVVGRHMEVFSAFLNDRLAQQLATLPPSLAPRWREAAAIRAGKSKPYQVNCNQLHVPRLPAIPFFDRAGFGWVDELEAKTDFIRAEMLAALETVRDQFIPYISYGAGQPVNQWQELNHSDRWSSFHLWRGGNPVQENLERCPETARALSLVPMAEIGGLCPNAMFSALAPHTRIPPHHGETNARLVVHLPLIVPPGCWYRVGFEERSWKVGEVLIFDDTIEHEARNDGDELRVVLIFDVWNPLLEPAEREIVQTMATATREFAAARPPVVND